MLPAAVDRKKGDSGKLQDLQDVGIAHFILNGDAQKIKVFYGFLGFQGKQGYPLPPHDLIQIHPGGIYPFTPHIFKLIEHVINDLNSQMGHTNLVYVRKAHGKPHVHPAFILHHRIDLASDIAGRLFHLKQDFIF